MCILLEAAGPAARGAVLDHIQNRKIEKTLTIPDLQDIEALEGHMLNGETVECPVGHLFAPGVYIRTCEMDTGLFIVGQKHLTKHTNIVHTGKATVLVGDEIKEIVAPFMFVSEPGVRKCLLIHEKMLWSTIHVTNETDLDKLEALLIEKSPTLINHQEMLKRLQGGI